MRTTPIPSAALGNFLFPVPARRTTGGIIAWWERRRLAYNVIVGVAGLTSIGVVHLLFALPPGGRPPGFPPQIVIVVGVFANVCYLFGPTVEIAVEKLWGGRVMATGPTLFRMGLTFSTGLVLLPTLIAGFDWIYRILRVVF
jgi:hypothetical protein